MMNATTQSSARHQWMEPLVKSCYHQGPLNKDDSNYKGCNYNATVEWEYSSITHEPLNIFGHDAPEICAEYGQKHNLLNEAGWKQFCHIANQKETSTYDKCCKSQIIS